MDPKRYLLALMTVSVAFGNANLLDNLENEILHNEVTEEIDVFMSTPEMILSHGYPAEVHEVITEDQYILQLHRIPRSSRNKGVPQRKLPAVIIAPGMMVNSALFVINGPNNSLAYSLSDGGYDVWMLNFRGLKYSTRHAKFTAADDAFWDFSLNELGIYDIPAAIDYILKETGHSQLDYISYSMGSTTFFICMSEKPQYSSKIRKMVGLSPAVFDVRVNPLLTPLFTLFNNLALDFAKNLGVREVIPNILNINKFFSDLCRPSNIWGYPFCDIVQITYTGSVDPNIDKTKTFLYYAHYPDTASVGMMVQYNQMTLSKKFCNFDFGPIVNLRRYGRRDPPPYNLTKATTPVALFYAEGDRLTPKSGVLKLAEAIPNLQLLYKVPIRTWGHQGVLLARNSKIGYHHVLLDYLWNDNFNNSSLVS